MDKAAAARRLRIAIDMYEVGERMQRQRLRRLHPGATDAQIEAKLAAWRQRRPGAEFGDCPGTPSTRFA